VPGKNIRSLRGQPLIYHTIRCARSVSRLSNIAISSDDSEILDLSKQFGVTSVFHRPAYLSTDTASKWLVWRDLLTRYEEKHSVWVEYLVDLDITTPLRRPEHVEACIDLAIQENCEVVITSYPSERNPYFNMMQLDSDGAGRVVAQSPSPIVCRQDAPKVLSLSPAVYVVSRRALFQYDFWSQATCRLVEIEPIFARDIDSELDFHFIEFLIDQKYVDLAE
jgi:CMP-N,N'-diacetyllegionaminic acid synthase